MPTTLPRGSLDGRQKDVFVLLSAEKGAAHAAKTLDQNLDLDSGRFGAGVVEQRRGLETKGLVRFAARSMLATYGDRQATAIVPLCLPT